MAQYVVVEGEVSEDEIEHWRALGHKVIVYPPGSVPSPEYGGTNYSPMDFGPDISLPGSPTDPLKTWGYKK